MVASPGAVVFVTVLLVLRGYGGTVHALPRQITLLVESFFDGPDVIVPLLLHALPLAMPAGVGSIHRLRGMDSI